MTVELSNNEASVVSWLSENVCLKPEYEGKGFGMVSANSTCITLLTAVRQIDRQFNVDLYQSQSGSRERKR